MDTRSLLQRSAALLTAGAALIHVGVAGSHFQEWWLAGLFFVVVAAVQLGWALWLWQQPTSPRVLLTGAVSSIALVSVWLVSRTTGMPFGPGAGDAEPIGVADSVCVGLELAAAILAGAAARRPVTASTTSTRARRRAVVLTAGVAALTLVATGTALAAPEPAHDRAPAAHDHGPDEASAVPDSRHHHDAPNLPDVSSATAQQTAAARDLLDRTIAATKVYRDPARATAAGFDVQAAWQRKQQKLARAGHLTKNGRVEGVHVPNARNRADGKILDPNAPETLVYSRTAEGTFTLVGVLFTAERKPPPAAYQPYLRWHTHEKCHARGAKGVKPVQGVCPQGTTAVESGAMTHLWFVADTDLVHAYARKPPREALVAYQKGLA